jgi:hypothetical protein
VSGDSAFGLVAAQIEASAAVVTGSATAPVPWAMAGPAASADAPMMAPSQVVLLMRSSPRSACPEDRHGRGAATL